MILRRIVVVSREAEVQQLARRVVPEVFAADDLVEALDTIRMVGPDLIFLDYSLASFDVNQFLNVMNNNLNDVPIIAIKNEMSDINSTLKLKQPGIYDYLHSNQDYGRLEQIINKIQEKSKIADFRKDSSIFFADACAASVSMAGFSQAILDTLKMIKLVAASRCNPILIVGETGTGKELAAKAVHEHRHPNEPFVAVNCAALTANLLESELFGHAKGSFTSADHEKTGLLECACNGTIFLDEISEMPLDLQAKLLRVLQEKTFRKVGGIKNIPCNASIIASSNRNLSKETRANRFRQDLYYRLNICPVSIPPLRSPHRKADIAILAEYFLRTATICPEKIGNITSFTKLATEALQKHDWPGNVRELKNVIERAILLEKTDKIGLSSIIIDFPESEETSDGQLLSGGDQSKDFSLAKAEHELISRALQQTGWQKTQAASLLGITRATLYAKVKQYNIEKCSYVPRHSENEEFSSSSAQPAAAM